MRISVPASLIGTLGALVQKVSSVLNTIVVSIAPSDWITDDNRSFMVSVTLAAGGAGNVSAAQIKNPAASGKTVYVDKLFVTVGGATADIFRYGHKNADLTTDNGTCSPLNNGGAASAAHMRSQNNAVAPAFDTEFGQTITNANDGREVTFERAIRLDAGEGFMIQNNGSNTSMRLCVWIREY